MAEIIVSHRTQKGNNKTVKQQSEINRAASRLSVNMTKTSRYVLFGVDIRKKDGSFTSYRLEFIKHSSNA